MSGVAEAAGAKRDGWGIAGVIFLVVITAFAMLPMAWMFVTSIKTQFASTQYPPEWWPSNPTPEQYEILLSPRSRVGQEFLRYL